MTDGDDYVFAEPDEDPIETVFDCWHGRLIHLRKEVDIFDGETEKWSTAILCGTCIDAINNNPDDPREVFPSGTREDQ